VAGAEAIGAGVLGYAFMGKARLRAFLVQQMPGGRLTPDGLVYGVLGAG
jgi:hypothetical protein